MNRRYFLCRSGNISLGTRRIEEYVSSEYNNFAVGKDKILIKYFGFMSKLLEEFY